MKAIRIHAFGGTDVLRYEEVTLPALGADEARVRHEAIGINFVDIYQRAGLYKPPVPFTLGQEAAGIVEAVGAKVTEVKPGDRVAYSSALGAYAKLAHVPAWRLVPVPAEISLEQAAAVMLQGMTAHYLARATFPLKPGDTALVHAAAGGVGALLVQLAKAYGARVIGTVSTEAKARVAQSAGADEIIFYTTQDFAAAVKHLTNGQGVEVVYDSVGKTTFDASLNCLKPRGMLVLYGQSSGAVPPFDPQMLNAKGSLFLTRPTLAHYTATRAELLERSGNLFDWMRAGKLTVRIAKSFPLAEVAAAQDFLTSRQAIGKVLLIP